MFIQMISNPIISLISVFLSFELLQKYRKEKMVCLCLTNTSVSNYLQPHEEKEVPQQMLWTHTQPRGLFIEMFTDSCYPPSKAEPQWCAYVRFMKTCWSEKAFLTCTPVIHKKSQISLNWRQLLWDFPSYKAALLRVQSEPVMGQKKRSRLR